MLAESDQCDDGGCQVHNKKTLTGQIEQRAERKRPHADAEVVKELKLRQGPTTAFHCALVDGKRP